MRNRRASIAIAAVVALLAATVAAPAERAQNKRSSLPPIPNLAGKILTVNGAIEPANAGQTLMHEHILIDYKPLVDPTPHFEDPAAAALYEQPFTLATAYAARHGQGLRTRKFMGDIDEARDEVLEFKKWGGKTIVDVTNIGLGRDPRSLQKISNATGLSIVMGAGWYARDYHPRNMDQMTVEEMTDIIVRDIVVGAEGTTVRSGIIGEIGVNGNPLTDNEMKSVRASARASRLTGAPMTFHVGGVGEEKFRVLDAVAGEGVDLTHVVMGHSNSFAGDLPFVKRLLERGVFIEFDYLGLAPPPGSGMGGRGERPLLAAIVEIIKAGYADRIVLGHDICAKQQMKKYGGTGFSYISEYFLPELQKLGVSDEDVRKIMIDNPRRALVFAAPKPLVGPSSGGRS